MIRGIACITRSLQPLPSMYVPRMIAVRILVACIALLLLSACASEGFEVSAHTQSVAYHDHVDPALILSANPPTCATLPPLTPTTYGGLAPLVDMTFLLSLRTVAPSGTVLSAAESIARMNAAGLAGDWQSLARDYATSGVMDRERLSKIGKALGVQHLIMPVLGYIVTNANPQVSPFDITVAVTVWVSVYTSLQVWDAERGAIEWASTANCSVAVEVPVAAGYPIHQALRTSWSQMFIDLIENRKGSLMRERISPEAMQAAMRGEGAAKTGPATNTSAAQSR